MKSGSRGAGTTTGCETDSSVNHVVCRNDNDGAMLQQVPGFDTVYFGTTSSRSGPRSRDLLGDTLE